MSSKYIIARELPLSIFYFANIFFYRLSLYLNYLTKRLRIIEVILIFIVLISSFLLLVPITLSLFTGCQKIRERSALLIGRNEFF